MASIGDLMAGARRVLFIGDSITYAGLYVNYIEAFLRCRLPDRDLEIINLGLPSETASGLSEPGHAGGAFPRPCVHSRLARALDMVKPDLMLACYGMNDGIYYPLGEERFAAFREGMARLVDEAGKRGIPTVVLTPPPFDPVPLAGKTLPAGEDVYPGGTFYEGYDEVLATYSEWPLGQREAGWRVIDLHGPIAAQVKALRELNPKYTHAADGVHPTPTGHWLMAQAVIEGIGLAGDGGEPELAGATPMPWDPQWDADAVAFERSMERLNRHAVPGFSSDQRAAALLDEVRQPQRIIRDAWLTAVGHERPGIAAGLPLAEAEALAREHAKRREELLRAASIQTAPGAPRTLAGEPFPGIKSDYRGFDRYDFHMDGCRAWVVVPKKAAEGKPWIWRAEFFDHEPQVDVALLERGWHLCFINVGNTFGCPSAMKHWDAFHEYLTKEHGLSQRPALEGLSRGGLYCYNWARDNTDKVSCIYGDAPVCDFKSWPAGQGIGDGNPPEWTKLLGDYGFASGAEALAYTGNPVDNLEPLAEAGIPLLHVYGDADTGVPPAENTLVVKERYEALGGTIDLIVKEGVGHHPHSLEDPAPIVDWILAHCR